MQALKWRALQMQQRRFSGFNQLQGLTEDLEKPFRYHRASTDAGDIPADTLDGAGGFYR